MNFDRQLARLMAAMIVMIIAYILPSAVQAHEGHAHHGHHQAAMVEVALAPPVVQAETAPMAVTNVLLPAMPAASSKTVLRSAMVGSMRPDDRSRGCCPGPCKGACCGTMSCCVPGILSAPTALPTLVFGHVVLASRDVNGRSGLGPEALPRPPRTLA